MDKENLCPCCSDKKYKECCSPYHSKEASPPNALALMRSRYSAYALQLADYIIETTHPDNPSAIPEKDKWKQDILNFSQNTDFKKLEIIRFNHGSQTAYVTFVAHLQRDQGYATLCEKSHFEKIDEKWLYRSAEIS